MGLTVWALSRERRCGARRLSAELDGNHTASSEGQHQEHLSDQRRPEHDRPETPHSTNTNQDEGHRQVQEPESDLKPTRYPQVEVESVFPSRPSDAPASKNPAALTWIVRYHAKDPIEEPDARRNRKDGHRQRPSGELTLNLFHRDVIPVPRRAGMPAQRLCQSAASRLGPGRLHGLASHDTGTRRAATCHT